MAREGFDLAAFQGLSTDELEKEIIGRNGEIETIRDEIRQIQSVFDLKRADEDVAIKLSKMSEPEKEAMLRNLKGQGVSMIGADTVETDTKVG